MKGTVVQQVWRLMRQKPKANVITSREAAAIHEIRVWIASPVLAPTQWRRR